jgi:hypothetical protein
MFRTFAAAALWALTSVGAEAGSFTCAHGDTVDAGAVTEAPAGFLGRSVSLRGVLNVTGKTGVMLTPASGRAPDEPPVPIAIYFENGRPADLSTRARHAAIVGRVLTCADIGKNAAEAADRANAEEEVHPGEPEVVYLGMVAGVCHYRDDMFAILVSSYRLLAAPPPH